VVAVPAITPLGLDLPAGAVSQGVYVEATNTITLTTAYQTVLQASLTVPAGAAVLQLFAADVRRLTLESTAFGLVRLAVGSDVSPVYHAGGLGIGMDHHNFVQHLWLNMPEGTHAFRVEMARDSSSSLLVANRMMALLLLKL